MFFWGLLQTQALAPIISLLQVFCQGICESISVHEMGFLRGVTVNKVRSSVLWLITLTCETFPIEGYQPLQEPKLLEASQASILLHYMDRLVSIMVDDDKVRASGDSVCVE